MRKINATIAQVLLLFLVLPFLALLIGFMPQGAQMMDDFFWSALGEIPIFQGAADVLNKFFSYDSFSVSNAISGLLYTISETFLQTFFLGVCIAFSKYLLKPFFMGAPILSTLIGLAAGLFLWYMADTSEFAALIDAVGTVAIMGVALFIMLRGSTQAGVAIAGKFLLDTFCGALYAACAVGALVALLEAPLAIHRGMSLQVALTWYLVMISFMLALVAIWYFTDTD